MGIQYQISCKDCKITRDLDKLRIAPPLDNRADMLFYSEELKSKEILFREALVLEFISKHISHNVIMFDDCGYKDCELYDPDYDNEYVKDVDFFK